MVAPTWFWPGSGISARGVSLVPYATGMAIADWTVPVIRPFSFANSTFQSSIALGSGSTGLAAAASGGNALWAVDWIGNFWSINTAGGLLSSGHLPSGQAYIGVAIANNAPYFCAATGALYNVSGTYLASWPGPAQDVQATGSIVATLLPAYGIGLYNTQSQTANAVGFPSGIAIPTCFTLNSGSPTIALGGLQSSGTPALSGAVAAAPNPQNNATMAAVGSGFLALWQSPSLDNELWSVSQSVTGLAPLNALAWRPDGTQILATSPASGIVEIINYTAGLLSLAQIVVVPGACSVTIAGNSTVALVAQSGSASVVPLTYAGGSWASGTPITGLPGICAVAPYGTGGAVAAYQSGLAYFNLTIGGWTLGNELALPVAPLGLTVDPFMQVYAFGAASGSGVMMVASGVTYLGSGVWIGGIPTSIAVQQGRVLVASPPDGYLYELSENASGTWVTASWQATSLSLGSVVGLALSTSTLFVIGSGATLTYGFSGAPFTLTPIQQGAVSQLTASSGWVTTNLGIGHTPSCCAYDANGNLWIATVQNTIWNLDPTGKILSYGILPVYSGQAQTAPLGASALLASGGHVYLTTSLAGALAEII